MSPPASSKVPVRVHERMTASSSSSCIHRVVYIPIQPKESSAFSSSSSASAADDKNTSIEKCKLLKKKNKGGSDSTLASSNSISTDLQQGAVKRKSATTSTTTTTTTSNNKSTTAAPAAESSTTTTTTSKHISKSSSSSSSKAKDTDKLKSRDPYPSPLTSSSSALKGNIPLVKTSTKDQIVTSSSSSMQQQPASSEQTISSSSSSKQQESSTSNSNHTTGAEIPSDKSPKQKQTTLPSSTSPTTTTTTTTNTSTKITEHYTKVEGKDTLAVTSLPSTVPVGSALSNQSSPKQNKSNPSESNNTEITPTATTVASSSNNPIHSSSGSFKLAKQGSVPLKLLPDLIYGRELVEHDKKGYYLLGSDDRADKSEYKCVTMAFPYRGTYEVFPLVTPRGSDDYTPIQDLKETTEMIANYAIPPHFSSRFGTSKLGALRKIIKACNRKNEDDLALAVDEFNDILMGVVDEMDQAGDDWKQKSSSGGGSSNNFEDSSSKIHDHGDDDDDDDKLLVEKRDWVSPPTGNPFLFVEHVLEQSYSRAVTPFADQLKVKGFSNNVYGEVKQNLVDEFIKNTRLRPGQVFLDMGSGIGNVVLQVAAQCLCESWGVEIMEKTSSMANDFVKEFESRMKCYNRPCGKIVLKQADFLNDPEIDEVISRADVIFVNNYIFDPELNQQILHKFLDLKENAKVISLRAFTSQDSRKITARTSQSIGSILKSKEYFFGRDHVSWMSEGGKYFIHTVDRSGLMKWESISSSLASSSPSSSTIVNE